MMIRDMQLVAQLGRAHSLREICGGLASCEGKLAHLGAVAPRRSTLAYANAHRPWALYQTVFYQVLARCRTVAGAKPFRFKNKLLSLDATVIDLCAEMFPWAVFRRAKGAVKLHFTLDHDGYLPTFLVITDGKHHEGPIAREQTWRPGTILVFDKGYTDFAWFAELTAAGGTEWADPENGVIHDVPGVEIAPSRARTHAVRFKKDGRDQVMTAWREGRLATVALPQLTAGGTE